MGQEAVLLDTTVLIHHLRGLRRERSSLFQKALATFSRLYISAISIYEIEIGSLVAGRHSDIEPLLLHLNVLDLTKEVAAEGAKIFSELRKKRLLIESHDIFIAATARSFRLPLLTENLSHFQRIDRLEVTSTLRLQ